MTPLQRLLAALKLDTAQRRRDAVLAVLLTVIFGGAVVATFEIGDDDGDGRADRVTGTIHVDGKDRDRKADDPLPLTPAARDVAVDAGGKIGPGHGENQRDETPAEAPALNAPGTDLKTSPNPLARKVFKISQRNAKRTTTGPDKPLGKGAPLAAQSFPGCRTAFVRNQSDRRGARIATIKVHYTAGPNIRGLADMTGLTAWGNNPRSQVSWHLLIDREGHCYYNVPLERKAWHAAGENPFSVGIEVVNSGREPNYIDGAGLVRLRSSVRYIERLYGIPHRRAIVRNCVVIRSGINTHYEGGSCNGGHVDIRPFSMEALMRQLAAAQPTARAQRRANSLCTELDRYRHGPSPRPSRTRAHKVRAYLVEQRWACNAKVGVHK